MKPKSIGIIRGAGPLAGAFLLKRILSLSGEVYGCYRDADFPQIFLISFPCSEMLCPDMEVAKLRKGLIPNLGNKLTCDPRENCPKSTIVSGIVLSNTMPLTIVDLGRFGVGQM